jgi:heme/copper-type cytochrome/quinol oxidase subunit 2
MPEQPGFLFWWAIFVVVILFIGVMGTLFPIGLSDRRKKKEERRRKAEKFTPTHRRTRER